MTRRPGVNRRRLALVLAPMAVCSVMTAVMTARVMTTSDPDGEGNDDDAETSPQLDYVLGSGAPPPARRQSRGGDRGLQLAVRDIMEQRYSDARPPPRRQSRGGDRGPWRRGVGGEDEEGGGDREAPPDDDEEGEDEAEGGEEDEEEQGLIRFTPEEEGEEKDDDDDPRPKRRPKGKKWKGWRVDDGNKKRPNGNDKRPNFPNDVGSSRQWWRKSRLCFEVDRVCHERNENEWFYYAPRRNDDESKSGNGFQPTMELKSAACKYDGGKDRGEPRISINLESSSVVKPERIDEMNGRCRMSPTPNHVVLQSLFNDMIGEFYSRTLLRLYHFMTDGLEDELKVGEKGEGGGKMPWEEDIQFYVHIPYGNKKMLDGHKLLLSGMLSNPDSPAAKSLIDLFVEGDDDADGKGTSPKGGKVNGNDSKGGEDGNDGSNGDDCECYEKMVFCGYDTYTHPSDVKSKDMETVKENEDDDNTNDDATAAILSSGQDLKYSLWSAGKLDGGSNLDGGSCGRASGTKGMEYECREWDGLRNFLSSNFVRHYPTLERDLEDRRRNLLLEKGAVDETYGGDTREFNVVGFTQRTYRRAWLNLPSILKECDAASLPNTICVEINVENAENPFEQLLMHRSLDAMIGVHGAQLTQAILLPDHAHVLELLPWITDYIRGKWVQTTHGPTPLGVIFHNTNLNHVGFSLDRSSVPLCEGVPETAEELCFMKQRRKFIWENRDFNAEGEAMMRYIKDFVLFGRDEERSCEELKEQLDKRFVLYNVWCSKPRHWFPALVDGEKACVHGTEYPIDHTDEFLANDFLFDSRAECCAAHPAWCEGGNESDQKKPKRSPESAVSLFHNYHKLPPKMAAEDVQALRKKQEERAKAKKEKTNARKKRVRKKKERQRET